MHINNLCLVKTSCLYESNNVFLLEKKFFFSSSFFRFSRIFSICLCIFTAETNTTKWGICLGYSFSICRLLRQNSNTEDYEGYEPHCISVLNSCRLELLNIS